MEMANGWDAMALVYVRRIKEKASWPVLTEKNINSDQFKFLGNCPPTPPLS